MNQYNQIEDTIDLKALFFSLIAQWKLFIICILMSLFIALVYLRVTPNTYAVNALVQVEEKKDTSVALLDLIQRSPPTQATIEIFKSRLILGPVIEQLHLDLIISSTKDTLSNKFIQSRNYQTEYQPQQVRFKENDKSFNIHQFDVPLAYLDKKLILEFHQKTFCLIDPQTKKVLLKGKINQQAQETSINKDWKITVFTQDSFDNQSYYVEKKSLASTLEMISKNYEVKEKGKGTNILELSYKGQNTHNITNTLNTILTVYTQKNIEQHTTEKVQRLQLLDGQLPDIKKQLDSSERKIEEFRQAHPDININKKLEFYLNQGVELEAKKAELQQKQMEITAQYSDSAEHTQMYEITNQLTAINEKIEKLNETFKKLPDIERQYLQLYREVEVKRQLYSTLVNSYQRLSMGKTSEIGNVHVVDTAIEPVEPIKPKKLFTLFLSVFIGLILGTLLALLRTMFLQPNQKNVSEI